MIPREANFVKSVMQALRKHCGVQAGDRLLLAVSGGADSTAMLRALATIAPRRRWELGLVVAHVQHHLRARAERDAEAVRALAERLELPYCRADLRLERAQGNLEDLARSARYDALARLASEHGCPVVATAHHGDDQIETMLMRLLRGASVRGLGGIAWRRPLARGADTPRLIRPLLGVGREDILAYLGVLGQHWCEDFTNTDLTRMRARLRQTVAPGLKAIEPDLPRRIGQMSEHLREAARVVDDAVARAHRRCASGDGGLNRRSLRRLRPLVLKGLLRHVLLAHGASADRVGQRLLGQIARAVRDHEGGSRQFEVSGGLRLIVGADRVSVEQA